MNRRGNKHSDVVHERERYSELWWKVAIRTRYQTPQPPHATFVDEIFFVRSINRSSHVHMPIRFKPQARAARWWQVWRLLT